MRILMLSGGIDSTLCLHLSEYDGAIGVDYGQPHVTELRRAKEFAWSKGVPFEVVAIEWSTVPARGLLGGKDITSAAAVVPGRNAMFIALAAAKGATEVTLGCNGDDYGAFVDCRPEVLEPVAKACGVRLNLPLSGMSKREVVSLARDVGVDLSRCMSCYRGTACGGCAACKLVASAMGVAP